MLGYACSKLNYQGSPSLIAPSLRVNHVVQSTVGKKMADVHFTTMPYEPNTVCKAQRKPNFYNICPCTIRETEQPRFKDLITFLSVFMSVVKVFVR